MHLDVEQIERLLHGELDPGREAALHAHVASCLDCRDRIDAAGSDQEEIFSLLRRLDHPIPNLSAGEIAAGAVSRRWPWKRIAAGIVLVLASSGLLYAAPGSALPDLLRQVGDLLSVSAPQPPRSPGPESTITNEHPSGISVVPGNEFEVVFTTTQSEGVARVRIVDSSELHVRTFVESVTFDLDVDGITVENTGATGNYEILLPRAAPLVVIRAGNAILLQKEGDRIITGVAPDSLGTYTIPLGRGTVP